MTRTAIDALLVSALLVSGSLLWICCRRLKKPRSGWLDRRRGLRGWEPIGIGA